MRTEPKRGTTCARKGCGKKLTIPSNTYASPDDYATDPFCSRPCCERFHGHHYAYKTGSGKRVKIDEDYEASEVTKKKTDNRQHPCPECGEPCRGKLCLKCYAGKAVVR